MAKTYTDQVYSGQVTSTDTTIATIATNTTFVMKGFFISNMNSSDGWFTFKLDTRSLLAGGTVKRIPAQDTIICNDLNIPITAGKTIRVQSEASIGGDYYIWGVNEVTS